MKGIKFLVMTVITLICAAIALIPPSIMYFLWHMVNPTTQEMKVVLVLGFMFFGGGFTAMFFYLAFALWAVLLAAVVDA
jgi:hypothetical protein